MSIYVTGDTHIPHDIKKLNSSYWKEGTTLTKNDYLIVCGDFGLLWTNKEDKTETYWKKWFEEKPWTTLFVDGNHENHYRLNKLKEVEMFGGRVGHVSDSIFHLKRGDIYEINEKSFFCLGGALSIDRFTRVEGKNWWREERPSYKELDYALTNLENRDNKVDYIITHTLPYHLLHGLTKTPEWYEGAIHYDSTTRCLQRIYDTVEFTHWYGGHFHKDVELEKLSALYHTIQKICQ